MSDNALEAACQDLIEAFQSRPTLRAGSLITTVFGDSIAPRGGVVWLGSLIEAMAGFGISERLVRTSVFRLAKDGWLEAEQIGRRSYYSLTGEGSERFRAATHRIYGEPANDWQGSWCLLMLPGLNAVTRDLVRKECGWLGFGAVSTNLLAHPGPDMSDLEATLKRLGVDEEVVVMTGCISQSDAAMRRIVRESLKLDEIDQRYGEFIDMFAPTMKALDDDSASSPRTAFLLRTLLIQEYRKILLRDPHLHDDLLPRDWHGKAAYSLCRDIYRRLYAPANVYLTETMQTADGPLPDAGTEAAERFGGLDLN